MKILAENKANVNAKDKTPESGKKKLVNSLTTFDPQLFHVKDASIRRIRKK